MLKKGGQFIIPVIGISFLLFCFKDRIVFADSTNLDANAVTKTIQDKQNTITELNQQIKDYQTKIHQKESEKKSLANELDLLQSRTTQTQLSIDETNAEIDVTNAEISQIDVTLVEAQKKLDRAQESLKTILENLQVQDGQLPFNVFYSAKNFSELFDNIEQLQQVSADLGRTVADINAAKIELTQRQSDAEQKQTLLQAQQQALLRNQTQLAEETDAKQILISQTQSSEKHFQSLLVDLQHEQTSVQGELQKLQSSLENKINPTDAINGGLLSWPISVRARGISATFHDPTYPFRNLFEHPGIDLPAPIGTPVHAAAAGYVAWTRRGVQYGNYVMIIHSDGIATLYAHLSRIDVVADQFLPRGGQVGAVGMTGLTTGPHLHFEVRKNGIPTDPLPYLPSL